MVPPAFVETVSSWVVIANVAVTDLAASIVTVHDMPVHAPDQPVNVQPVAGVAVSATLVPWLNVSLQSVPHTMPVPATVPKPTFPTLSVYVFSAKFAVTDFAASIVTVHVVPVHAPDQPANE